MDSSPSDRDRPDAKDQQTNPFVAFRRFADSQMSSLVNNAFGIFETSPIRRQQAIDEYESTLRRARGMSHDYPRSPPAPERSQPTVNHEAEQVGIYKQNHDDFAYQIKRYQQSTSAVEGELGMDDEALPYGDDDQYLFRGERCIHSPRPGADNPGVGDLVPRMSTFGITYLYTSPYSPLNLEQEEILEEHSGKLRAAFADLLAYQKDENLLSNNTAQMNARMSPSDWLVNMTGMMIFGKGQRKYGWGSFDTLQFHRLMMASEMRDRVLAQEYEERPQLMDREDLAAWCKYDFCNLARRVFHTDQESHDEEQEEFDISSNMLETARAFWKAISDEVGSDRRNELHRYWTGQDYKQEQDTDHIDDKNPKSELSFYHGFLDTQTEGKDTQRAKVEEQAKVNTKPSILSTLTTTEQRTLPDGSITTKVVLRKRFSDGVEEVTENVHTQNEPQPQRSITSGSTKKQDSTPQKPKDEKRSGWFWS